MIETSFTMRGTTSVILQLQQILRLPLKMSLRIDPAHIWHVIYHARSNKRQPPPSQNIAPATQNEYHDWSISHMKRHLQRAVQQESASNFTNYCACHVTWIWWLIRLTYETSFTICRASKVTLPTHQVLHLPCKMNLSIDPPHIWNVIYNAREQQASSSNFTKYCACHAKMNLRTDPAHIWNVIYHAWSNSTHLPTSPNIAPATQNDTHGWSCSHMKRNSTHPPTSPNIAPATQNGIPKYEQNLLKTVEASCTMRGRPWSEHEIAKLNPPVRGAYVSPPATHFIFVLKITTFRALAIYPNFTKYCACHEKSQSTITKCCACHEQWHSDITKYCACHEKSRSNHQMLRLPRKVTLQHHQVLCLPRRVTELLLSWTVALLSCYFTELLLYFYFTELLLYWTVTLRSCYFMEQLLE